MMAAIWMHARSQLRSRWRTWMTIALIIGVASGVVMAAAAGARRSDSAVGRFLDYVKASDVDVEEVDPAQFHAVAALPQVDSASADAFMLMGRANAGVIDERFGFSTLALTDPTLTGGPAVLVAGRLFDLDDPGEAIINESALRHGLLKIGDRVPLQGFTFDQLEEVLRGSTANPKGPSVTVTIVGAIRVPTDLSTSNPPPGVIYTGSDALLLTPALYREIGETTAGFSGLSVRLKNGRSDIPAFTKDVERLTNGQAQVLIGSDDVQAAVEAQRATHTEAIALWLFAGFAAIATLLVIGQSISRQIFISADNNETLRALGMTRRDTTMIAMIQLAATAIAGIALGIVTAVLLSPLAPIGLAGDAEVDRGFHLDTPVIAIGALAGFLVVLARALPPAWRAARAAGGFTQAQPSRVASSFAGAGMPASSVAGVQMALDPGQGRNAVPVRSAVAGTVVAVAVLIAALTFGSSLTHLAGSSRLQGWTWDYAVGNPHSDDVSATAIPLLERNQSVGGITAETFTSATLDGRYELQVLGIERVKGTLAPPVLEGQPPRAASEIALGTKALRALGKRIGDSVRVSSDAHPDAVTMRIVGRVLITPIIVNGEITLGDGALVSLETAKSLAPPETERGAVNVFLVALRPGADRAAAEASLRRDFPGTVLTAYAPSEVENLRRIDALPFALAGLLGLLAVATIAHTLVTSVRRRRKDLAVFKTLGFLRRQVSATVAWQASTLTVIAATIGLVAGFAGGRWLWVFYAGRLGVRAEPAISVVVLVLMVPGAVLLANAIAALPARSAARTRPALILRSE